MAAGVKALCYTACQHANVVSHTLFESCDHSVMAAGGKALCCTACQDGQSIASGSSNDSVHVWRVEYVTCSGGMPDRYTGFQCKLMCQ